jgi:phage tail-like protein
MVQTHSSPTLRIQLTPMQVPEAVPLAGLAVMGSGSMATEPPAGTGLLLHPGEASEMVVQVQNLDQRSVALNWSVEGNFPPEWCRVGTEGNVLTPGAQMDAVLYFQIPSTFFEDQQALSPGKKEQLVLNFYGQISIAIDSGSGQEQIEQAEFVLYVRPRSTYTDFLPVLYREVDFISRFMKIFEQAFEPVIQSFNVMWANLDPLTAPQTLLPFLAHWVAWPLDPLWDLQQQRRLISRAVELYCWRGTRKGLRLYLHLYTGLPLGEYLPDTDKPISITEPFGQGFVLGAAKLGESAVLGGGQPYHFRVHLRPDNSQSIDEQLVRRIIEQEKPAYCTYELIIAPIT